MIGEFTGSEAEVKYTLRLRDIVPLLPKGEKERFESRGLVSNEFSTNLLNASLAILYQQCDCKDTVYVADTSLMRLLKTSTGQVDKLCPSLSEMHERIVVPIRFSEYHWAIMLVTQTDARATYYSTKGIT